MAAEEKTALRCHFRGSLRRGERAGESVPQRGCQTNAAARSTDFIVQLEQRGRGVLPGGGASYSRVGYLHLGRKAGSQPKRGLAATDAEAGARNSTAGVQYQNPTLERVYDPAGSPHIQVWSGGGARVGCIVCTAG